MTQCGEVKTGLLMKPDQEPPRSVLPQHDLKLEENVIWRQAPRGVYQIKVKLGWQSLYVLTSAVKYLEDAEYWHCPGCKRAWCWNLSGDLGRRDDQHAELHCHQLNFI